MAETIILSVTVPDGMKTTIVNEFCEYHGYQATIKDAGGKDIPNPETKAAFAKRKVAEFIKESVKSLRATKQAEIARKAQIDAVDAILIE